MVKVFYKGEGEIITLYDRNRGDDLFGTLYVNVPKVKSNQPKTKEPFNIYLQSLALKQAATKLQKFNRAVAVFCLTVALLGFGINFLPIVLAEASLKISQFQKPPKVIAASFENSPNPARNASHSNAGGPTPTPVPTPLTFEEIPSEFQIIIPKLNLESIVVTNVDPSNSYEYNQVLAKEGVAHARGSYLPSQPGPVILFAHSTNTIENILQFNAKFFGLKDLEGGDEIIINYNNKDYRYKITTKKVTSPNDLASIQETKDDLVLSTCWPPGATWQRLLVFAKKV